MESKVTRLTHEVVDGVCLHLSIGDAQLLKTLLGHGIEYTHRWPYFVTSGRPPAVDFGRELLTQIHDALKEEPPACKE